MQWGSCSTSWPDIPSGALSRYYNFCLRLILSHLFNFYNIIIFYYFHQILLISGIDSAMNKVYTHKELTYSPLQAGRVPDLQKLSGAGLLGYYMDF